MRPETPLAVICTGRDVRAPRFRAARRPLFAPVPHTVTAVVPRFGPLDNFGGMHALSTRSSFVRMCTKAARGSFRRPPPSPFFALLFEAGLFTQESRSGKAFDLPMRYSADPAADPADSNSLCVESRRVVVLHGACSRPAAPGSWFRGDADLPCAAPTGITASHCFPKLSYQASLLKNCTWNSSQSQLILKRLRMHTYVDSLGMDAAHN